MEKKGIIRCVKEILLKHEGNTSEGAIYWDSEWVGGRQIPMGMGGWRQEGGKLVSADKAFYKEMADFISQELDKAREEVLLELLEKKTNYNIEEVGHGYKVTQEYVLVSDIEKELDKLTTK